MAAKISAFWQASTSAKYTRMPSSDPDQDYDSSAVRSFQSGIRRLDDEERIHTPWPNFSVQDGNKPHSDDQHSVHSRSSTTEILKPMQPSTSQSSPGFFLRVKLMCTRFPWRDMSYMVGTSFAVGSAAFVINGFFLLLPMVAPDTDFTNEVPYATPASSMIGTLIFVLGSWIAVLEALNLERGEPIITEGIPLEESTGSIAPKNTKATIQIAIEDKDDASDSASSTSQTPPLTHAPPPIISQQPPHRDISPYSNLHPTTTPQMALLGSPMFIYLPTTREFLSTYLHNYLFLAAFIQFIGSLIFLFASITAIPGVLNSSNTRQLQLLNLLPATIGGFFFLLAGVFQTISAQADTPGGNGRWWKPQILRWEWWVGVWYIVGSVGFALAGALPWIGVGTTWGPLQGTLADFWGSWAFLLGSLWQWWGAMRNYS